MMSVHVFAETNYLISLLCMPSKRKRDALVLHKRWSEEGLKLYVPYLCFQEARYFISRNLPQRRCDDLLEFHRFAEANGEANWNFEEVKRLLDAATGEVNRTKAVCKRELADFARALGDGIMHADRKVFDFLEALELDALAYNYKLILSSVLVKAKELYDSGEKALYFVSLDKSDLKPKDDRDKKKLLYDEAGLTFVSSFVLPDMPATST
jgi:hypothetical protein